MILGDDVQAYQNKPAGSKREPRIIGGRRSSGMTLPSFSLSLRANRVFVVQVMIKAPMMTPPVMERKGSAPTPSFQPRFCWKAIGYASKKRYKIPRGH